MYYLACFNGSSRDLWIGIVKVLERERRDVNIEGQKATGRSNYESDAENVYEI